MHRSVVALLPLLLIPLFVSSVALAQPASGPRPGGRSVCVLSAVGDKFAVQKVGITVLGNEFAEVAIESWGIDDHIVRKIGALLGKGSVVRRISFPKGAMAAIQSPNGKLIRDREEEFREAVRSAAAASSRCDTYVALTKGATADGHPYSNAVGLGIVDSSKLVDNFSLAVMILIRVYDGSTFATLQRKIVESPSRNVVTILAGAGHGLHRQVDKSWWPAAPRAVAQDARIREAIRTMVDQGLSTTVPGML